MPNILKMYRGLDILRKHLGEDHVRADDEFIYAGGVGSANNLNLTEVETAMLVDAGWHLNVEQQCWVISF